MQRFSVQHEPRKDSEGDYILYADHEQALEQIATLTESLDYWKGQWRLMESANKKAEEEKK